MTGEIQDLQAIHMSVQTADLNMIGFSCEETITLSCGLMNIGRGICSVTIKPSTSLVPKHRGSLDIEINRPYMRASIDLGIESFLKTKELLLKISVRPATLVILLDQSLRVNLKGDLLINKETPRAYVGFEPSAILYGTISAPAYGVPGWCCRRSQLLACTA